MEMVILDHTRFLSFPKILPASSILILVSRDSSIEGMLPIHNEESNIFHLVVKMDTRIIK